MAKVIPLIENNNGVNQFDFTDCENCDYTFKEVDNGQYYAVKGGTLYYLPPYNDGSFDNEEVVEVTAPVSQGELDKVNKIFGTSFKYEEFAGR